MSRTSKGLPRYPGSGVNRRPLTDHQADRLGKPLQPADIYVNLRRLLDLSDAEVRQALVAGAAELAEGRVGYLAEVADKDRVIAEAVATTPSRLMAWRRRGRAMTWDELRVLLLGLKTQAETGELLE